MIVAAHQKLTEDWWRGRDQFELYSSQLVFNEAAAGDPEAAERRLSFLTDIPFLAIRDDALRLAASIMEHGILPPKVSEDAAHVAIATVHGLDYLVTWNLKHLANADRRREMGRLCENEGYEMPKLCTPEDLLNL